MPSRKRKQTRKALAGQVRQAQLSTDSDSKLETQQPTEEGKKEEDENDEVSVKTWLSCMLISHIFVAFYFWLDDIQAWLATFSQDWSTSSLMISIQWNPGMERMYKGVRRIAASDLSWAASLFQQSAFYCALAWSVYILSLSCP